MYEFDRHAQLSPGPDGVCTGDMSDLWNVGPVPNGGYLMALAAMSMATHCSHPDPLTITGHYLRPARAGHAQWHGSSVKRGGSFDNAQVSLMQDGTERCRFLGAYGTLDNIKGPSWQEAAPPDMPPPEACERLESPVTVNGRYEARFDAGCLGWLQGETGRPAEFRAWIRHVDERPCDLLSLLLFADALPPPVFARLGPLGWVPTVELTVHLRSKPAPGFVQCRFRTRYVTNGLLEADGELWDAEGKLVALSRQLALLRQ